MDKIDKVFGVFFIAVMLAVVLVMATSTLENPITRGNYTDNVNFSINTTMPASISATIYWNESGGAVNTTTVLLNISNSSADQLVFTNATVNLNLLTDKPGYNFSITVTNLTGSTENVSIFTVRVGNVPPNTSAFIGIASNENLTDSITLNVTADDLDDNVSSVFFNITNGTG